MDEFLKLCIKRHDEEKSKKNECNNDEGISDLEYIKKYPHIFFLACLMHRDFGNNKAWKIPEKFCNDKGKNMKELLSVEAKDWKKWFIDHKAHKYNNVVAKSVYEAIKLINETYNDDISLIWEGKPNSASVVTKLLEFDGVGVKIATMTANILVRRFGVEFSDYSSIDISPDSHVKRVFKRLGFINKEDNSKLMYKAREIYPEFPGVMDLKCWEVGRDYCHKRKEPECSRCPFSKFCDTYINKK